ncbi:MAG: hypothetical protein WBX25_37670 [Rhodomicrobium sp.]
MSILRCFVASVAALLAGSSVYAQSLDDDTTCGVIVRVVSAPSPDKQKVKEVLDYTLEVMKGVDRLHRLRGQTELFPQMSKEGRSSVALTATERCRSREAITLADTAIETYEAMRTLRTILGLNSERRKRAHRTLLQPRSAPALLAER